MKTCGYHAKNIKALSGGVENMGPNVKALYDKLMKSEDEECIAAESQVVYLFTTAMAKDAKEG